MELAQRVAKYSETRERRILGFDLDMCIKLKFPPRRVGKVTCDLPPYEIGKSDVLPNDRTRWLVSKNAGRSTGLHVQRGHWEDAYSIHDIRYTHHYNYVSGEVRIYHADTRSWEEYVSTAHRPVPEAGQE
jgi:hypothetical protein